MSKHKWFGRKDADAEGRQLGGSCLLNEDTDFFIQEAYKSLRTNVMFALAGEREHNIIIVTSSEQSEGKSTTAANLAVSFAQNGRRVLLVDCDMRRPQQGRLLGLRNKLGLSDLLVQADLFERAIQDTHVENLRVLLAGSIPPNPSELLGSRRMQDFLDQVRGEYDMVILDTPPVNVVTDATVLCPRVDGVLVVVRAGRSARGSVLRTVEQLNRASAHMLGFVLNGATSGVGSYGGSYGRYGRYGRYGQYGSYSRAGKHPEGRED